MRKLLLMLAIGLSFSFILSCKSDDDNKNDTIAEVYDYVKVDFDYDEKTNEFYFSDYFYEGKYLLFPGDVVLVYMEVGWDEKEKLPVWMPIPISMDYQEGNTLHVMDYKFKFTRSYFEVIAKDYVQNPQALKDITFRVFVTPGYDPITTRSTVDFNDYNAVIKHYNIDESKIKIFENKSSEQRAN